MRRILLLGLLATTLAAPSAHAATTVRVGDFYPADATVQPGVLATDETGDVNNLTISYTYEPASTDVTIEDTAAPLEPGEGCTPNGKDRVRCKVDGLVGIRADLGAAADVGTARSPGGATSCNCVTLLGGPGNDSLTSFDGATVEGGDGDDTLAGMTSTATGVPGGLGGVNDDGLSGGAGNDTLDGGTGGDFLSGGAGDDTLRGGDGNDLLNGGAGPGLDAPPPAGWDQLDGGTGHDALDDGDAASGQVTPDNHVGGPGVDTVNSYFDRERRVRAVLSRKGGQGEGGEHDRLVNVEIVWGGRGDDTLSGDGDGNQLFGGLGSNELHGRGGADWLVVSTTERQVVTGDRGDDLIQTEAWTPGTVGCGPGRDRIIQPERGGSESRRRPRETDPGASVSSTCEAITRPGAWGIDPVPDRPVSATRRMTFKRPRGAIARKRFALTVTSASRPYRSLARGISRRSGITVRLPKSIARKARRKGMTFRAEVHEAIFATARLQMIWRFRVKRAR